MHWQLVASHSTVNSTDFFYSVTVRGWGGGRVCVCVLEVGTWGRVLVHEEQHTLRYQAFNI